MQHLLGAAGGADSVRVRFSCAPGGSRGAADLASAEFFEPSTGRYTCRCFSRLYLIRILIRIRMGVRNSGLTPILPKNRDEPEPSQAAGRRRPCSTACGGRLLHLQHCLRWPVHTAAGQPPPLQHCLRWPVHTAAGRCRRLAALPAVGPASRPAPPFRRSCHTRASPFASAGGQRSHRCGSLAEASQPPCCEGRRVDPHRHS